MRISRAPRVKRLFLWLIATLFPAGLLVNCNDTGMSPAAPEISYKEETLSAVKNVPVTPNSVVFTNSGVVNSFSVNPPLPAGLSLNSSTGAISGTATAVQASKSYTVTATGPKGSGATVVKIVVQDTSPSFKYKRKAIAGVKNSAIVPDSVELTGTGAISGYAITPDLPSGLTLSPTTGLISGTPDSASYNTYTVTATGPGGTGSATLNICVEDPNNPCNPVIYYKEIFVWTTVGNPLPPDSASADDGGPVESWSVEPALPAGITLNATTGLISGTPTAPAAAKEYTIIATGPTGGKDSALVVLGVYPTTYPTVLLEKGKERFQGVCTGCHGFDGKGSPPEIRPGRGSIPPLANSDFIMANRHRPLRVQLLGLPNFVDTPMVIIVNGDTYEGSMGSMPASDSDIAGALTFIRAMLNGNGTTDFISVSEAKAVRDSLIGVCAQRLQQGKDDCDTSSIRGE